MKKLFMIVIVLMITCVNLQSSEQPDTYSNKAESAKSKKRTICCYSSLDFKKDVESNPESNSSRIPIIETQEDLQALRIRLWQSYKEKNGDCTK